MKTKQQTTNNKQTKAIEIHIAKYTMKRIPEMHLVQIVINTSNLYNLYYYFFFWGGGGGKFYF